MGRKEYGRLGLGSNCLDAKELTLVPNLSSFKCIDVAAGSAQSFAVTELGSILLLTSFFFNTLFIFILLY